MNSTSTELQREIVEEQRNRKRLQDYRFKVVMNETWRNDEQLRRLAATATTGRGTKTTRSRIRSNRLFIRTY